MITKIFKEFFKKFFDIEFSRQLEKRKNADELSREPSFVTLFFVLIEYTILFYGVLFWVLCNNIVMTIISIVLASYVVIYTLCIARKAKREYFSEKVAKAKKEYDEAMLQWMNENLDIDIFKTLFADYTLAFERFFYLSFLQKLNKERLKKMEQDFKSYNYKSDTRYFDAELENALKIFDYSLISEVTEEDLKNKYRNLVKKAHPDVKGGSEKEFKKICNAYELLKRRVLGIV